MSVRAAIQGDDRSREIIAAIAVDLLQTADARGKLPCAMALCTCIGMFAPLKPTPVTLKRPARKAHPALVRACIAFLMRPRTPHERLTLLSTEVSECHCDRTATLVDDLHRPGDFGIPIFTGLDDHTQAEHILIALLICVQIAVCDVYTVGPLRQLRRAHTLANRQTQVSWPASLAEVVPYGTDASLEALCAWAPSLHHILLLVVTTKICQFLQVYAHTSLVVCTVVPDVFIPTVEHILADWSVPHPITGKPISHRACAHNLSATSEITLIFRDIDEQHLVFLLGQRDFPWPILVDLMSKACFAVTQLQNVAESGVRFMLPPGGGDLDDMLHSFRCVGGRVSAALGLRSDPTGLFRAVIDSYSSAAHMHPSQQLSLWYRHLFGGHLCGAPGCNNTYVSKGRRLRACAGCQHVFYCSHRCQRRAWRHDTIAHRGICSTITRLFVDQLDSRFATYQDFEHVCLTTQLAGYEDLAMRIVEHLRVLYWP